MKTQKILFFCLLIVACKQGEITVEDSNSQDSTTVIIAKNDISKIKYTEYVVSPEVKAIVQNWNEYNQLQEQVSYIKNGDFSYFNDNKQAITALFKGLYNNMPELLNENSILARIKTVETKFYQLESLINLDTTTGTELMDGLKQFLFAINNLDLQMNKIIELQNQNIIKP